MNRIWRYIKGLPRLYSIGGAVIIVAVLAVGIHLITRGAAAPVALPDVTHVMVSSVASLTSPSGPLPVTGKVTSLSDATILAESSGEIVSLNYAIGDYVGAGSVIAELENSSQQAAVLQAQGAFDAAKAALANASGSTAANSTITSSQAATAAANAQTSATTALQSTYTALDDAIHAKADTLFNNPRSASPTLLSFTIPNGQLVINAQNERAQLEAVFTDANAHTGAQGDVDANAAAMTADAQTIVSFLNDLIQAINIAQPNQNISAATIAADQSMLAAARSEVLGAISSLAATKSAYDTAQTNVQTTANSAGSGTTNNIAAAQAGVTEAQGALDSAQAALEKTIIRSPISGTIVSLAITQGDFVSSFAQVAEVSNPSALEIDTYVTPDDAKTLAVGGKATIDDTVSGVITSIAPALDPTTGKIPVKVGITGNESQLTDGDTVTVSLSRSTTATAGSASASQTILIPIIAAKITPQGPVVFEVSSSTLVSVPVVLGDILGDQVTVTSGITLETDIVTDARGLSNGEVVVVDPSDAQTSTQ